VVVVRARIEVNQETSTLKVTSDPLPQVIFGVPLRLQRIMVNVDRQRFMLNPTNCGAHEITATIVGAQRTMASVSSPFAVGACKSLTFNPSFRVFTTGRTSRASGASLDAKLSFPAGSLGNAANVARVRVSLPKQLPSRLTTLQKACLAQVFATNPAACPRGSVVGIARSSTPVLPVPLQGPVYFVSHGGEAFPQLVVVLEGDGVRVDVTGTTFINKKGITSSTFKAVPDVPVRSFELYLPQGRNSALAANGNLCDMPPGRLAMPTELVAQNGLVIRRSTKIGVSGCRSRSRPHKRARRASLGGRRGRANARGRTAR
jgi:hypothetical protein